jgi:phage terminase large subunit GpA-like protein
MPAARKRRRTFPIITIQTDRLKDEIAASLTREEPGPGAYHLYEGLDPAVFAELAAERRGVKGWERKAGGRRNEALDLAVYGKAAVIVLKAEKIDWASPPSWAAPVKSNSMATVIGTARPPQLLRRRRVEARGRRAHAVLDRRAR